MNPKISVIVPVYKVEQFLSRCIDSILNQTFTDFELLLIDDGSPDNSGTICDEYALKDKRIRVFHKENGGVCSARNLGLDNAVGTWVTFVDSDDWIKSNYLLYFIQNSQSDFIVSGHQQFGHINKTILVKERNVVIDSDLYDIWKEQLNSKSFVFWYTCGKFYKNEILQKNNIRFNQELIYSEDFCFVLEYMLCVKTCKCIESVEYQYFIEQLRYDRYTMDFMTYYKHLQIHDEYIKKLEKKCAVSFLAIRNNLANRLFRNFVNYVKPIKQYETFKKERDLYSKNIENIHSFNLCPTDKTLRRFTLVFSLPFSVGFYIMIIYFRLKLWLK